MAVDIWPVVHAERRALADDLAGLPPERWTTPSLCAGRSVQETLAHMAATAAMTPTAFFAKMLAAGFRFERMAGKEIRERTAGGPDATLQGFRAVVDRSSGPPGPATSWLGETLVHAEDIRRPLGLAHSYPIDAVTRVIDFYAGSNLLIGGKRRIAGLTLRATDADWSRGSGPAVEGPAKALMMVTAGRSAFLDDLSGAGLDTLTARCGRREGGSGE
ncbi:MAG: maleylpyruvate isomerase family mycothiol-dependent enzyme [Kineosporiaceae bacterium]